MLIEKDGGMLLAGPADMVCILKLPAGTFHVAFFEEHPMPGPVQPINELPVIRLRSKMHHTSGSPTFEGAQQHVRELRAKIELPDSNVLDSEAIPVRDPVSNLLVPNWTLGNISLRDALIAPG
jgi:hypothetical protein